MKIFFDSDFKSKLLVISFEKESQINHTNDIQLWREEWLKTLASWHSPYKALINFENLDIKESTELKDALKRMFRLLNGFHLRKACGFGQSYKKGLSQLPIKVTQTEAEARKELGIRDQNKRTKQHESFRSLIQLESHFQQHFIELTAPEKIIFDSQVKIKILHAKLLNHLMQWHSSWHLLVDCNFISFHQDVKENYEKFQKFFQGFFLKTTIGYGGTREETKNYPFKVYLSRHKALYSLESQGEIANKANCSDRKKII